MTQKHLRFETKAPTSEEDALRMGAAREGIPIYMHDGLVNYILHGRSVGHFLWAVLTNDLKEAVSRGDDKNTAALASYVRFLHNNTPMVCWGDEARAKHWLLIGGLTGHQEQVKKEKP